MSEENSKEIWNPYYITIINRMKKIPLYSYQFHKIYSIC
jgi:hypothetical protein